MDGTREVPYISLEPPKHEGSKRKTVYEKAMTKRRLEQERAKTRVNIGVAFPRWRQLRDRRSLKNDAMVAVYLLDRISACTDSDAETIVQLRGELREREATLGDVTSQALNSAQQLQQLRETMSGMQAEIEKLKAENDLLKMESQPSQMSISPSPVDLTCQPSLAESSSLGMNVVKVVVSLENKPQGQEEFRSCQYLLGCIGVSGTTKWDVLDGVVRRLFKEYIMYVDPVAQLGLNTDSVMGYSIGNVHRIIDADTPELLPCVYLVGDSDTISVMLKGLSRDCLDGLAFETLIPKSVLQQYITQLERHKRLILSGPSGTGKSFLARRLAEYLVLKEGRQLEHSIATFSVDNRSTKELKQFLSILAEQCKSVEEDTDIPTVLVLDNLHHAGSLGEIFTGLLRCRHQCPYIIGTMNQTPSPSTNLQLRQNFRWVLCANHTEPVKGFLGRFLRRKLREKEISSRGRNEELVKVTEWIPCVWHHLNCLLETHSSSDVTIGPGLFLSCPMDVEGSRVWFTDLWNYFIIPYVLDAVREGLQRFGRKAAWEDPTKWVTESFPWASGMEWDSLLRLRPEDVGLDGSSLSQEGSSGKQAAQCKPQTDPPVNKLMRLRDTSHHTDRNDTESTSNSHKDETPDSSQSTL